jgi:hypothetical protein
MKPFSSFLSLKNPIHGFLPQQDKFISHHKTLCLRPSLKLSSHIQRQTNKQTKQTPWPESARELYRPTGHRLLAKLVQTFADRVCHVVSVTDFRF